MDAKTIAEIRKDTSHFLGVKIENKKESAAEKMQRMTGAEQYVLSACKAIETLNARAAKEVEEGKLTADEYKAVKRYIQDAAQICLEISAKASQTKLEASGEHAAYTQAVAIVKAAHDVECSRIARIDREVAEANAREQQDAKDKETQAADAVQELQGW